MSDETVRRISVLIVDDHAIVRQGLRTLLELMEDICVVGEAANGKAAVEQAARLRPDVVLMDLVMPEMNGIQATQQIKALGLGAKSSPSPAFRKTSRSSRPFRLAPPVSCSKTSRPATWWKPSGRPTAARRGCTRRWRAS